MKIIGLAGKAGSGKDTAALLIQEILAERGLTSTKLSFASKLKDACSLFFGWDRELLEHDFSYKEGEIGDPACDALRLSRREIMQKFGTDAVRNGLHPDAWIIILRLAIERGEYDGYDVGLLPDCRFKNELKFVREMGGNLLRIERGGDNTTLTIHTLHQSETDWLDWDDWDNIVNNHVDHELSNEQNIKTFKWELNNVLDSIVVHKKGGVVEYSGGNG